MRYCADTWFILALFQKEAHSRLIFEDARQGKSRIMVPIVVFAEATKKLLQKGVPKSVVDQFWGGVEASEKVQLVPADKSIAQEAALVSLAHGVPMIDSFVAATAKLTGCDLLLSGDTDYSILAKKKYVKVQSW